jgi:WD40 repeat protein
MNWISLLKAQQADFLQRVKKTKISGLSLLESQVNSYYSEIIGFFGEPLTKIWECSRTQAEILAKTPPPVPPDYPEHPECIIPFSKHFQQQVEDYLVRELIVDRVIKERWGRLLKKSPQGTLENLLLDDEGNLLNQSKFHYLLTNDPSISVQIHVTDGESLNGIKKDKIRWSINQADIRDHQLLIFICLFYPVNGKLRYEKLSVIAGFLPTNLLEFPEPKINLTPSCLLYAGGLSWYLSSFSLQEDSLLLVNHLGIPEKVETLPPDHPQKSIIGDWEYWQTLKGHTRGINCLAFSLLNLMVQDAQHCQELPILASGSRGETRIWDLAQGKLITTFAESPWMLSGTVGEIHSLAFSPDGQTLVSVGADSKVKIWHTGALDLIDILHKHNGEVRCVAMTNNGRILATGGDDRRILFWDLCSRQVKITLPLDDTAAHSLIFSPDGQILITGSYRKIKVWRISSIISQIDSPNLSNICLMHTLMGHTHVVSSLAISPDAQFLVSGSRDRTIKVWQLATGELIHTLKDHQDEVYTVALSPNGQIIASGSADKTIKLWHLATGQLLGTFTGHTDTVTSLAFTTSGDMLISASLDKTIKIWQRS